MEKLKALYSNFAREVLKKDYLLGSYWDKDNSFDIVSIEEENDCLYVKVRNLLSMEYGFIKWLVYADKIDYDKIDWKDIEININRIAKSNNLINYLKLVMLLSISDSPISDLCSYLKEEKKSDFEELVDRNIDVAKRLASK